MQCSPFLVVLQVFAPVEHIEPSLSSYCDRGSGFWRSLLINDGGDNDDVSKLHEELGKATIFWSDSEERSDDALYGKDTADVPVFMEKVNKWTSLSVLRRTSFIMYIVPRCGTFPVRPGRYYRYLFELRQFHNSKLLVAPVAPARRNYH